MPVASATAEPPEEPPQIRVGSKGFPVAPKTAFLVLAPAPNSGVLVLPITMAPARRNAAMIRSSSAGTFSAWIGEPYVVSTPSVTFKSFTPIGNPCRTPSSSPRETASSAVFASSRARSKHRVTMAFTAPSTASIRAMQESVNSTGDKAFRPIRRRASTALKSQGSVISSIPIQSPGYSLNRAAGAPTPNHSRKRAPRSEPPQA